MDRERRTVEKEVREVVADAESPLAQRHIRESIKANKFTLVLYAIAIIAPAAFLASFYGAKLREIRSKFRDPYALPDGFDPNTSTLEDVAARQRAGKGVTSEVPKALVLQAGPGSFAGRGKPTEVEPAKKTSRWW